MVHSRCVILDMLFDLGVHLARGMVRCLEQRLTLRRGEMFSFLLTILVGTKIYRLNAGIISDAHSHPRYHSDEPSRIPLDPLDRNAVHEKPSTRAAPHDATRIQGWSRVRERLRYASSICCIYGDLGRGKEPVCGR